MKTSPGRGWDLRNGRSNDSVDLKVGVGLQGIPRNSVWTRRRWAGKLVTVSRMRANRKGQVVKKHSVLKVVNLIITILVLNQLLTGFLRGMLSHEAFEVLHEGGAIVFAIAIAAHVVLNWDWIRMSYFHRSKTIKA